MVKHLHWELGITYSPIWGRLGKSATWCFCFPRKFQAHWNIPQDPDFQLLKEILSWLIICWGTRVCSTGLLEFSWSVVFIEGIILWVLPGCNGHLHFLGQSLVDLDFMLPGPSHFEYQKSSFLNGGKIQNPFTRWFQPTWKIVIIKMGESPIFTGKKNMWNYHPVSVLSVWHPDWKVLVPAKNEGYLDVAGS